MNSVMKRRSFLKSTTAASIIVGSAHLHNDSPAPSQTSHINLIGPKQGYSPHIGTMVSMMNWMRSVVIREVRRLSVAELDYIHDENANSIGAMLWHLAATERFYQRDTFEGNQWNGLSSSDSAKWTAASSLGAMGRASIKGYDVDFYLKMLQEVRDYTYLEFSKRDDDWLMAEDNFFGSPTNNYCKWFHVCEHESNHNGQIKFIKSRIAV